MGEKKADPKAFGNVVRLKFNRRVWRDKTGVVAFCKRVGLVLKVDLRRRHFLVSVGVQHKVKLPAGVEVVKPGTPEHPPTIAAAPKRHRQKIARRDLDRRQREAVKGEGEEAADEAAEAGKDEAGEDDGKKATEEAGEKP